MLWLGHMTFPFTSPWPLLQARKGEGPGRHQQVTYTWPSGNWWSEKLTFPRILALLEWTHWGPGNTQASFIKNSPDQYSTATGMNM